MLKNKKDVIELKITGGAGFGDPKKETQIIFIKMLNLNTFL